MGAHHFCSLLNAYLVRIEDESENTFLRNHLRSLTVSSTWTGLSDQESKKNWKWIGTDKYASFSDWVPGEPNNSGIEVANYELLYFPLRGRGQATRYIFIDNGIDFKETNTGNNWLEEFKPKMPFGQAPLLKDGDFEVAQSNTIIRYLGRKHGLYPDDVKEGAKVDMITDHVEDIRGPYVRMIYQNYEDGKDAYVKTLPEKFQYIENLLKKWGTEYISTKISYADYNLLDLLDILLILSPTCIDAFPTLKAYYNRMASRPNLKKYRDTEEFKKMPVNGNGKQ